MTYYSSFYPSESSEGAKGSAAFLGALQTATLFLYKRDTSAPSGPSGTIKYTFATAEFSENNTGWSTTIPAGTDPLYVVVATASSIDSFDIIEAGEWTTPVLFSSSSKALVIFLFQRRDDTNIELLDDPDDAIYTFSTGSLVPKQAGGSLNGWTQTVPDNSGGKYLYVISATAYSDTDTDDIDSTNWSDPVIQSQDGEQGVSGRTVSLTTNTQAIVYSSDGTTPDPSVPFDLTATAVNTSGTVYYEFIVNGSSQKNDTVNTYSYAPPVSYDLLPSVVTVHIREGSSDSPILASDTLTIFGIKPGSNGEDGVSGVDSLTVILSNEAHTLPTTNTGTVTYTGSGTTIRLYEGVTELLYDGVGTSDSSWKVVASGTNITPGTLTDSGNYVTVADHSAMTADTASITYTITGKRADGTAISIVKTQTFAKSLQGNNGVDGEDGDPGQSAIQLTVTKESATILAYANGALAEPASTVTGTATLMQGSSVLSGVAWSISGSGASGNITTSGVYTLTALTADTGTLTITASYTLPGSPTPQTYIKIITITKVNVGYEIVNTLPTTNLFDGRVVYLTTAYTASGSSARAVSLTTTTQYITYALDGTTPNPSIPFYLTATAINTSGSVYYEFTVNGTSVQNSTTSTYYYTPPISYTSLPSVITVQIREGSSTGTVVATDTLTIFGIKPGSTVADSSITAILSNEEHTLPISGAGTVTYTGSGTTIRLFQGATELVYDGVGTSNSTWKVEAIGTGIIPGTLIDSGNYVTVADHSSVTANIAYVNYIITGKKSDGTDISIVKTQPIRKGIIQGSYEAKKLYRYDSSIAKWTAAVAAVDLTGKITSTQIEDNSITAPKILAGEITSSKIYSGDIEANRIQTDNISAGAITAAKISVTQLDALSATIGTLRTATSGARVEISDNLIEVYDSSGNLRVKIGDLS